MAATRVVKNVTSPISHWNSERTRYAPQIATANAATCAAFGCSVGRNSSTSAVAIGSHMASHTTFQPAKYARS